VTGKRKVNFLYKLLQKGLNKNIPQR